MANLRTLITFSSMEELAAMFNSSLSRIWSATQKTWVTSWAIGESCLSVSSKLKASKVMKWSRMEEGNQVGLGRRAPP